MCNGTNTKFFLDQRQGKRRKRGQHANEGTVEDKEEKTKILTEVEVDFARRHWDEDYEKGESPTEGSDMRVTTSYIYIYQVVNGG